MKITTKQLKKIIREEYEQLPQAGDPAEAARLKAQRDAATIATIPRSEINTDIEVPVMLFDQLVEYLEDMSGLKMKGSGFIASRARELLVKLERETGAL